MLADPVSAEGMLEGSAGAFVALSKFVVANGMAARVKDAFRNRPHLENEAPGYVRMDVISPFDRPEELWLITFWTDEASFRAWHHGHLRRAPHDAVPGGLKLVSGETQVCYFEHVAS